MSCHTMGCVVHTSDSGKPVAVQQEPIRSTVDFLFSRVRWHCLIVSTMLERMLYFAISSTTFVASSDEQLLTGVISTRGSHSLAVIIICAGCVMEMDELPHPL